jgi:hypothetical protein
VRNFDYLNVSDGVEFFIFDGDKTELFFFKIIKIKNSSSISDYDSLIVKPDNFFTIKRIYFPSRNVEVPAYDPSFDNSVNPGFVYYQVINNVKKYYFYKYQSGKTGLQKVLINYDPFLAQQETSLATNFFIQKTTNIYNTISENERNLHVVFSDEGYSSLECSQNCVYYDNYDQSDLNNQYYYGNLLNKFVSFSYKTDISSTNLNNINNYVSMKHVPCVGSDNDILPLTLRDQYGDCGSTSTDTYYTQETVFQGITKTSGKDFGNEVCDSTEIFNAFNPDLTQLNTSTLPQTILPLTDFEMSNILYFIIVPLDEDFANDSVTFDRTNALLFPTTYNSSYQSKSNIPFVYMATTGTNSILFYKSCPTLKCKIYCVFGNGYYGKLCFDYSADKTSCIQNDYLVLDNSLRSLYAANNFFNSIYNGSLFEGSSFNDLDGYNYTNFPQIFTEFQNSGYRTFFAKEKFDGTDVFSKIIQNGINTVNDSELSDIFLLSSVDFKDKPLGNFLYTETREIPNFQGGINRDEVIHRVLGPLDGGLKRENYDTGFGDYVKYVTAQSFKLGREGSAVIDTLIDPITNTPSYTYSNAFNIFGLIDKSDITKAVRLCNYSETEANYVGFDNIQINPITNISSFDNSINNDILKRLNYTRENRLADYGETITDKTDNKSYLNCGKYFNKTPLN